MNRLFPALAGAALLLSACGSSSTPSATPTSSRELLSFSSASLGTAYVGESYSGNVAPLGGTGPYSVRLISGTLPSGLKFSGGNSGTISGTPSAVGSSTFTLEVSDANLSVKTQVFNLSVAELPPLDFVPTLPNGEVRGETRIPLTLMGPRGVRAARFSWVLPDNTQVTKVVTTGGNEAGRPLLFWKQSGHTLMLDFGFRLTPKNGVQVALISLKPLNDKPVTPGQRHLRQHQFSAGPGRRGQSAARSQACAAHTRRQSGSERRARRGQPHRQRRERRASHHRPGQN